jgi:hypothetical protein
MKDNLFYTLEEVREISVDDNLAKLAELNGKPIMRMIHQLAIDWLVMKSLLKRDD